MTARKCLFIQALDAGNAEDLRLYNAAILGGQAFNPVVPGIGSIGRGHGVLTGNAMLVYSSTTPDNVVHVRAGAASVRGTQAQSQGNYVLSMSSTETVTISSKHATLVRNDYVVAQVRDNGYATFSGDDWELDVVEGTPGAGNPAIPHDCLVLAAVTVMPGLGSTTISSEFVQDLRPHARGTGCITPVSVRADFPNPMEYDFIWETSTNVLLTYIGGAWKHISSNLSADWTAYNPGLDNITLGSTGTKFGRYSRFGRTVIGVAGVFVGTGNVSGSITIRTPVPAYNPGSNVRYMCAGKAFVGGNWYAATAEINPSFDSTLIFNFATAGTAGWNATVPTNWTNATLTVFFNYEAA